MLTNIFAKIDANFFKYHFSYILYQFWLNGKTKFFLNISSRMKEGRTEIKGFDNTASTSERSILIDSTLKGQCHEIFYFRFSLIGQKTGLEAVWKLISFVTISSEQLAAQISLCTAFVNLSNGRPSFSVGLATIQFS